MTAKARLVPAEDVDGHYGISRRMLCGAVTALAFAAATSAAAPANAAGARSAATGNAGGGPLPRTPLEQMRLLLKMMSSTGEAAVTWFYTGRIYAVRAGAVPLHLYNFEGSEVYWMKPLGPDSWSMAVSTLTFYRDRVTGEYLDTFDNPLTGKSVAVSANVLRSKPGQGAIYAPQSMTVMGETQPVTVEIQRSADVVWLTTSRGNPHSPQPAMEVNTLFAAAAEVEDPRRATVSATFSSVSLSHWSRWLEMGDEDGHLLWHAAGRKLGNSKELPASYLARAAALNTPHFTNPDTTPVVAAAAAATQVRTAEAPRAGDGPGILRFSYVTGSGGVPLSVAQAGDPAAPGILFIHGLGQSHMSFARQLDSPLRDQFHLVAFDMRGHGNSGKPWDAAAYGDSAAWAEDVARTIAATGLKRPLIVAWSYGTLVTADYVRHHGSDGLSGIVMMGALGGLAALPPSAFDPEVLAKMQELHRLGASPGLENTLAAGHAIVPLLTARTMPAAWTRTAETVNALVPPFARTAMGARMMTDNKDLVPRMRAPMLLLAGSEDKGTPRTLMQSLSDGLPGHAEVAVYEGSGHSVFAEEPERFNRDLQSFAHRAFGASAQAGNNGSSRGLPS